MPTIRFPLPSRATLVAVAAFLTSASTPATAQSFPGRDYTIRNFAFEDGEHLPELRIHYIAMGHPRRDARGADSFCCRSPIRRRTQDAFASRDLERLSR